MASHAVCRADELRPGSRRIVEIGGRSIGVFNVGGRFYGLRNTCPHQGAPLCAGTVGGTMLPSAPHTYVYGMEGRVVRCPWHGWEFDLETGVSPFDPQRRVKAYEATVQDGMVMLHV